MSRWMKMFGSPVNAARTLIEKNMVFDLIDDCVLCPNYDHSRCVINDVCVMESEEAVLEWLMEDDE